MKILDYIQFSHSPSIQECQHCVHFENNPALIEEIFKGLNILSSGYASVRDQDGICNLYQRYLSALDSCSAFERKGVDHIQQNESSASNTIK